MLCLSVVCERRACVWYDESATFVRGLFGPASTKEASNKPAES